MFHAILIQYMFSKSGKILAVTLKQGIKQLFSKSQIRDEFFVVISFMKLRANTMTSIGKMKYILLNHQKTDSLIFHDKKII